MQRQMSPLQAKYFGGKKRKAKKRIVRRHRTLGGASRRGLKEPVAAIAEKNGAQQGA